MAQTAKQPEMRLVVPSTPEHVRNGEADIIELRNGDLLLGYGRWDGDGIMDGEDYTIWTQHSWGPGNAHDYDWSRCGQQWVGDCLDCGYD